MYGGVGEALQGGQPGVVSADARSGLAGYGAGSKEPLVVVDDSGGCSRHVGIVCGLDGFQKRKTWVRLFADSFDYMNEGDGIADVRR